MVRLDRGFPEKFAITIAIKNFSGKISDRFSDQNRLAIFILKPDRD
jgi:hypothetical protein